MHEHIYNKNFMERNEHVHKCGRCPVFMSISGNVFMFVTLGLKTALLRKLKEEHLGSLLLGPSVKL